MLKKLLFIAAVSSAVSIQAQTLNEGFYRINNNGSGRYIYVRDCTGNLYKQDFGAIQLIDGLDNAISDPGSVMFLNSITVDPKTAMIQCDISSQSTGVNEITGLKMDFYYDGSICQIYKSGQYLYDIGNDELHPEIGVIGAKTSSEMQGKTNYRNWTITPIATSSANYFGFKPTVSADGKYYASFFADFAYTPTNNNIKTYYVSKVDKERAVAVIKEITGTVAKSQPVIIECAGAATSDNKIDITAGQGTQAEANLLSGVYFDNGERSDRTHESTPAAIEFKASTMRLLGTDAQGKLAFVNNSTSLVNTSLLIDDDWEAAKVLPHNQSYLVVDSNCPETLQVMTEEEYKQTAINEVTEQSGSSDIYSISGMKVKGMQKGCLYITAGRKFLSK